MQFIRSIKFIIGLMFGLDYEVLIKKTFIYFILSRHHYFDSFVEKGRLTLS